MAGGFIGVDVFFVISGYLISIRLKNSLDSGKFSLYDFYESRIRRILPALTLVVLLTIPAAWFYMRYSDFILFCKSLLSIPLFSSNFVFWRNAGYFGANAETQPLLHTWSLAVEEQFYLIFPLFLVFILNKFRRYTIWILSACALISLGISEYFISTGGKADAAFYLFPTRAWELLVGAILALLKLDFTKLKGTFRNILGILGLILILTPVFTFSSSTPTPGVATLLPVLGTSILIAGGGSNNIASKMLQIRPIVKIGIISFSLYLWHLPILVLVTAAIGRPLHFSDKAILIFIIFILSHLSWKYVENPGRNTGAISYKQILKLLFISSLVILALGTVFSAQTHLQNPQTELNNLRFEKVHQDFYVLGDSHANDLVSGISRITDGKVINYAIPGCLPLLGIDRWNSQTKKGYCEKLMTSRIREIVTRDKKSILLVSFMGPVYLTNEGFNGKKDARVSNVHFDLLGAKQIHDPWEIYRISLMKTLSTFNSLKNTKVIWTLDRPELGINYGCNAEKKVFDLRGFHFGDAIQEKYVPSNCSVSRKSFELRFSRYRKLTKETVLKFHNISFWDPTNAFCSNSHCKGFDSAFGYLYLDEDHLSGNGSIYYASHLLEKIPQFISS